MNFDTVGAMAFVPLASVVLHVLSILMNIPASSTLFPHYITNTRGLSFRHVLFIPSTGNRDKILADRCFTSA